MSDMFLNREELAILTGRKTKSRQIEALRRMGVPFYVNAMNQPVVARTAIEGPAKAEAPKAKWVSNAWKDLKR
jgi:hypothetical protein